MSKIISSAMLKHSKNGVNPTNFIKVAFLEMNTFEILTKTSFKTENVYIHLYVI